MTSIRRRNLLPLVAPALAVTAAGIHGRVGRDLTGAPGLRDEGESAGKAMCRAPSKGFFHIGVATRNGGNAVIEHGTMRMIRSGRPAAADQRQGVGLLLPPGPRSLAPAARRLTPKAGRVGFGPLPFFDGGQEGSAWKSNQSVSRG